MATKEGTGERERGENRGARGTERERENLVAVHGAEDTDLVKSEMHLLPVQSLVFKALLNNYQKSCTIY